MESNQTTRVLDLLKRFNNNETVCIDKIIEEASCDAQDHIPNIWLNSKNKPVADKTIRRVLDVLKPYFNFELIRGGKGEKGCYKAVTKQAFDNFMNPETLSLMALTFSMASKSELFENFDLDDNDRKIIEKELKNVSKVYEFKNKPFETTKSDKNILKVLEHSIKFGKCIIIEYPEDGNMIKIEVKPYRIVFMNENFYLACEVEHEDYMLTMYRISKINTIEETKRTFQKNRELSEFIKDIQTPFAAYVPDYKKFLKDVLLEVDSSKASFFKAKKHLKSQDIIEEKENGNIIVNFKVTQEREVESLIKSWLPYIKVIKPISLKEKIKNELKEYLKQ
ncbi:WYL domain-containing protein [Poseidonibacter ostreae]|uniref:WYL domain-containing protein n=1 Tax=Poseidonibacter ostreae TaxID=2654171 RepID=A0ABQ6VKG6_9BACT|nr:WYL domain-containing protein [Poseidonibacter ostreae]KAB7884905.1 WYL domain-containing protein [Poseidonibacter ostreae]KAB7888960.1 WYL domain-containing protein [Poseidonibacter ostreae]